MQPALKCDNWIKPGKDEIVKQAINLSRLRYYPDSDHKRSTYCKDYIINQPKKR